MIIKFYFKKIKCLKTTFSNLLQIDQNQKIQKKSDSQKVYFFQKKIKFFNFVVVIFRFDIIFAIAKLV